MNSINTVNGSLVDGTIYNEFRVFLCKVCGIELGANKQYLVSTRMRRLLHEKNIPSLPELIRRVEQGGDHALKQEVIDVMTTNETFWFRDKYPFDYLKDVLWPTIINERARANKMVRIWSAACSSGQEPYSISMIIEESIKANFKAGKVNTEIIATDLSSHILESAKKAHYDKLSLIRGLSDERARVHFTQVDDDTWALKEHIKSRVTFRPLNLQSSFFLLGKFDIVYCRNVLIYFSPDLKEEILRKIHGTLVPGGILFLGSSESVTGLSDYYEMIHCNPGVAYKAKRL